MTLLAVDQHDPTWLKVVDYAQGRIADLKDACVRLDATPQERERDAARIAELRALLQAAAEAAAVGSGSLNQPGATY